ncbi:MAG: SEC-C domain-containing protein [Acidobacteria bacterium]|nr:MAG: SEC-C domain-containing protein [Acidobacteriota bacterium]
MSNFGSEDLCPCDSGERLAACCGAARDAQQQVLSDAVGWLRERYEAACDEALVSDFFGSLGSAALERLQELPDFVLELLQTNGREWLVAEGVLRLGEREARAGDLLLAPDGPPLAPAARDFVAQLGRARLSLLRVEERRGDAMLVARDLTAAEDEPPRTVVGLELPRALVAGKFFGARLLPAGGRFRLSGCVYPFPAELAEPLAQRLREALAEEQAAQPTLARALASTLMIDAWLRGLAPPPRTLVDVASGEPVLLVCDAYDVADAARLTAALELEPDVSGTAGSGFVRGEPGAADRARLILDLDRAAARLEVLARTRSQADEGRSWLRRIAGDLVAFRGRTILDPVPAFDGAGVPLVALGQPLTAAEKGAHLERLYRHAFRHWPDTALPALGGLTPREAMATEAGRATVRKLIERYDRDEQRHAEEEQRPAVSFDFLRALLGLD